MALASAGALTGICFKLPDWLARLSYAIATGFGSVFKGKGD